MKNLFLLPTTKLSRLHHYAEWEDLGLSSVPAKWSQGRHIYIVSDIAPNVTEWSLNTNSKYEHKEVCRIDNELEFKSYVNLPSNKCNKIILTTDPDLIQDGVQAIDDEFLNWFIRNWDCESVKAIAYLMQNNTVRYLLVDYIKDIKYPIGGYAPGYYTCKCVNCKESFLGDKRAVQCEPCATKSQEEKMYTKEDVLKELNILMKMSSSTVDTFTDDNEELTDKWFEK